MADAVCVPDASELLGQWKGCSHASWTVPAAELFASARPAAARVMLNVGANKGFNAAQFLALWRHDLRERLQPKDWVAAIRRYATGGRGTDGRRHQYLNYQSCGACHACYQEAAPPHVRTGGVVHAVELLPSNRALLRWLARANALDDTVFRVHDFAASNHSGLERAPSDAFSKFAGSEYKSLAAPWIGPKAARKFNGTERVQVLALDDFLAREGLRDIYSVEIDTEGWDALVLEGMRGALRDRRITFVEFEYSNRGYWGSPDTRERRTLRATTAWMLDYGYRCFIEAGNSGGRRSTTAGHGDGSWLAPISGACWRPSFETRRWGNLLCSADPLALGLLHNLSARSYAQRRKVREERAAG